MGGASELKKHRLCRKDGFSHCDVTIGLQSLVFKNLEPSVFTAAMFVVEPDVRHRADQGCPLSLTSHKSKETLCESESSEQCEV